MAELQSVSWKLHSWQGTWKPRHLTADGKTTLCGHTIPKRPWMKGDGKQKRPCKNCQKITTSERTPTEEDE